MALDASNLGVQAICDSIAQSNEREPEGRRAAAAVAEREAFDARQVQTEGPERIAGVVRRAVERGRTRARVLLSPPERLPESGRGITIHDPHRPQWLEAFPKRTWEDDVEEPEGRGLQLQVEIVDWPGGRLSRKGREKAPFDLPVERVTLQVRAQEESDGVCIAFAGRYGVGKRGSDKAITGHVSPPMFRMAALPAPTEHETSQISAQRDIRHLPAVGGIEILDRSWNNGAGAARIMGDDDDKRIRHLLHHVAYEAPKRETVQLPKRRKRGDDSGTDSPGTVIAGTVGAPSKAV